MSSTRGRCRLLTVRLSDAEFEALRKACATEGARSLSDLARDAILQRVRASANPRGSLAGDLNQLGVQLVRIDDAIKDLSTCIERVLGKP